MATMYERSKELADRIRMAALVAEVKTAGAGTKIASAEFGTTVLRAIREVEAMRWADGRPFTASEIDDMLACVEDELRAQRGTLKLIKEGSVKALLQYNQMIAQLMSSLAGARG